MYLFLYKITFMKTTTISILRSNIKSYIEGVIGDNEPLLVNKGTDGAVIISLSEYNRLTSGRPYATDSNTRDASVPVEKNDFYMDVDIDKL